MILQIILTVFLFLSGIIIFNMYRREIVYENLIKDQASYMRKISQRMKESYEKLVELDRIGAFQSDDETGEFFQILKTSFEELHEISVSEHYGQTEEK